MEQLQSANRNVGNPVPHLSPQSQSRSLFDNRSLSTYLAKVENLQDFGEYSNG